LLLITPQNGDGADGFRSRYLRCDRATLSRLSYSPTRFMFGLVVWTGWRSIRVLQPEGAIVAGVCTANVQKYVTLLIAYLVFKVRIAFGIKL
jgi:hypothetical protein